MKTVFVSLNSKYSHTSLALRYLKEYCRQYNIETSIEEFTINHNLDKVVADLYLLNADIYGFSTYIFNLENILDAIHDLKKLRPNAIIFCGGPEVSYDYMDLLKNNPEIDFIIRGEGEQSVYDFLHRAKEENIINLKDSIYNKEVKGVSFLFKGELVECSDSAPFCDLDKIPFPYADNNDLENIKEKILYYESSRGCPFNCSYCMSSLEKKVRAFSLDRVFVDLKTLIDVKARQVKFVDRTFNYDKKRALQILKFINKHDNGYTNFHFEIAAWLLDEETLDFLDTVREGLFRFEIGIQSTNKDTLKAINRNIEINSMKDIILRLHKSPVHVHCDLIAGLPYENLNSFAISFDEVMTLAPEMFQLGFLKILKGTEISLQDEHEYIYSKKPPYEVMKNKYISYDEIIRLKHIEEVVERYYNGNLGKNTIDFIVKNKFDGSFFLFYNSYSQYLLEKGFFEISHRYSTLFDFLHSYINIIFNDNNLILIAENFLAFDLYSYGKVHNPPYWLKNLPEKDELRNLLSNIKNFADKIPLLKKESFDKEKDKKWLRYMDIVCFNFGPEQENEKRLFVYAEKPDVIPL